ncbi:MAG: hypothetical protein QG588_111, partial [Candidatus Poribacteria bacterium]|nr:hypothetical protein [Candidatus Poribacteria bacterium]
MTSYDHSLRPVFTENTVKSLQRGISINLIGPAGNGRERLLHDIRGCHLPDTTVVIINLKSYRQNYDGMIVEMGRQLGIRGKKPRHLTELIEKNNKQNK